MHILEVCYVAYDVWLESYATNLFFGEVWCTLQQPTIINQTPFLDYTICDNCLYKPNQLCVLQIEDHLIIIHNTHVSFCRGNFGTKNTILNLQRNLY